MGIYYSEAHIFVVIGLVVYLCLCVLAQKSQNNVDLRIQENVLVSDSKKIWRQID